MSIPADEEYILHIYVHYIYIDIYLHALVIVNARGRTPRGRACGDGMGHAACMGRGGRTITKLLMT